MADLSPIKVGSLGNGTQSIYAFDNGYGALVIHRAGDDVTNMFLLEWEKDPQEWVASNCRWVRPFAKTYYGTPLTEDVAGDLAPERVGGLLKAISELPRREA